MSVDCEKAYDNRAPRMGLVATDMLTSISEATVKQIVTGYKYPLNENDTLDLQKPDELWEFKATTAFNLCKYNVHSLIFLMPLVEAYAEDKNENHHAVIVAIIDSFLKYMAPQERRLNFNSEDHAIFIRTLILLDAINRLPLEEQMTEQVEELFRKQVKWMQPDKSWHKSNHGLMTDFGLLHAGVYFQDLEIQNKALKRISKLMGISFDDDGFCNENTPAYMRFNLSLYEAILNFCDYYNISNSDADMIRNMVNKGKNALRTVSKQNGKLPPIGDAAYSFNNYGESINASRFFKNGNFAVIKNDELYLSLIAGRKISAHKHADDCSIFLSYKDDDIFVDSGMLNYDYNNCNRILVRSTAGHSGIYPTQFETFDSETYLETVKAGIESFEDKKNIVIVESGYCFEETSKVSRRISFMKHGELLFEDAWQLETATEMRDRFVLAPGTSAETYDSDSFLTKATLKTVNGCSYNFYIFSLINTLKIDINNTVVSFQSNKAIGTKAIDIIVPDRTNGAVFGFIPFNDGDGLFAEWTLFSYYKKYLNSDAESLRIARRLIDHNVGVLSTKTEFRINDNVFTQKFTAAARTDYLYLYSLSWITPLLQVYNTTREDTYAEKIGWIFERFFCYLRNPSRKEHLIDHSVFVRTCVCIYALNVMGSNWKYANDCLALCYCQGIWAFDDSNYANNNHGIMTDFGLLHLSVLFSRYDFAKKWEKKAIYRIVNMCRNSFDSDGVNNENSIFYHKYNTELYTDVIKFCSANKIQGINEVCGTIELARDTFKHFLWPYGGYAPIGDSDPGCESVGEILNQFSFRVFQESGYAIIKDAHTFLSLKCGWTNTAHKHLDETSVTLRYKDVDLVCDSGRYNYDNNDPIRKYCVSTDGHSGIYPLMLSDFSANEYFKRVQNAKILYRAETGESYTVICSYEIDNGDICVTREVIFEQSHKITFIDSWICKTPQSFRINFVLSPKTKQISKGRESSYISSLFENSGVKFRFDSSSPDSVFDAFLDNGYYCPEYCVAQETNIYTVVTENSHSGSVTTNLLFGDDDMFCMPGISSTDEYRAKWSGEEPDGTVTDDKFSTTFKVSVSGNQIKTNILCGYGNEKLRFAYYIHKFGVQDPVHKTAYIDKSTYGFTPKTPGRYAVKMFIKRKEDHYKHGCSYFSKYISVNEFPRLPLCQLNVLTEKKPPFLLTVDTEALPGRAKSDWVNRLIYGKVDGNEYGIGKQMDIADKYGVQMVFFLELAEYDMYGSEIIEVGKYILSRGHSLQLHLHPSMFKELLPNMTAEQNANILNDEQAEIAIKKILDVMSQITDTAPVAYRGGGYYINDAVIKALGKYNIELDFSYNSNRPQKLPISSGFCWANGVSEIPITIAPEKSKFVGNELNFNASYVFPHNENRSEFFSKANNFIVFLRDYYRQYGDDKVATLVMHSWSFCKKEPYYDQPIPQAASWFDYLLARLAKEFAFIKLSDIIQNRTEQSSSHRK